MLIYHDVERISEVEAQALLNFIEGGGLVIASGSDVGSVNREVFTRFYIGMLDEFFRLRVANPNTVWPPMLPDGTRVRLDGTRTETHDIGLGRLISVPTGALGTGRVIQWIEGFFADKDEVLEAVMKK